MGTRLNAHTHTPHQQVNKYINKQTKDSPRRLSQAVFKMERGNVLRLPEWRYEDWWLRDLKLFQDRVAKTSSNDLSRGISIGNSNGNTNKLDGIVDAELHKNHVLEILRIAEEVEICCSSVDV